MGGRVSKENLFGGEFEKWSKKYGIKVDLKEWENVQLPINFYPVGNSEGEIPWLYTSGIPISKSQIQSITEVLNVGLIVTLTSSSLNQKRLHNVNLDNYKNPEFVDRDFDMLDFPNLPKLLHVPISDGFFPEEEKILRILKAVKETKGQGKNILINCWLGKGRSWWTAQKIYSLIENIPLEKLNLESYNRKLNRHQQKGLFDDIDSHNIPLPKNKKISKDMVFLEATMQGVSHFNPPILTDNFSGENDFDWKEVKNEVRLNSCGGDKELSKELEIFVSENFEGNDNYNLPDLYYNWFITA